MKTKKLVVWNTEDEIQFGIKILEQKLENDYGQLIFWHWYYSLNKRRWWPGFNVKKVINYFKSTVKEMKKLERKTAIKRREIKTILIRYIINRQETL